MTTASATRFSADDLDATFAALADRTRRAMVAKLARGEASVLELAAPHTMSQPAISKHLKVLERAGLITRGRDAQRRPCRLEPRRLKLVADWIATYREYWEDSYARLDDVLQELQGQPTARDKEKERSHANVTKARSHRRTR
jgi:DNA-binding transcriptional ArsR family regulator